MRTQFARTNADNTTRWAQIEATLKMSFSRGSIMLHAVSIRNIASTSLSMWPPGGDLCMFKGWKRLNRNICVSCWTGGFVPARAANARTHVLSIQLGSVCRTRMCEQFTIVSVCAGMLGALLLAIASVWFGKNDSMCQRLLT